MLLDLSHASMAYKYGADTRPISKISDQWVGRWDVGSPRALNLRPSGLQEVPSFQFIQHQNNSFLLSTRENRPIPLPVLPSPLSLPVDNAQRMVCVLHPSCVTNAADGKVFGTNDRRAQMSAAEGKRMKESLMRAVEISQRPASRSWRLRKGRGGSGTDFQSVTGTLSTGSISATLQAGRCAGRCARREVLACAHLASIDRTGSTQCR